jgi:membrane-associated phospholipid phosphatase
LIHGEEAILMKKLLFFCCLLAAAFYGYAQSVYTYDIKKDALIGSLSLGLGISPFLVRNEPEQVPGIVDKNDINAFDRTVLLAYNEPLDRASDAGVYALLALPALSVMGIMTDKEALATYGIMYAEAFLLTFGTKDLLKHAIIRYRPYMYTGGMPDGKEDDYYNSFPSGSTAYAFLSAGFLAATFSAEYPDSPWKLPVIGGAYALAGGIAAFRILSGSHFLTDVLTGAAIGSLYGWLIPTLHKKTGENKVSIRGLGNALMITVRF